MLWLQFQHQLEKAFITKEVATVYIIVEISLLSEYSEFPQAFHLFLIFLFVCVCSVLWVFLNTEKIQGGMFRR